MSVDGSDVPLDPDAAPLTDRVLLPDPELCSEPEPPSTV